MRWYALFFAFLVCVPSVHAQSFTDVPKSREEFEAVEDLRVRGIFEGRPDGTFGPNDFVNRAEAITVVVRAVANVRNLPIFESCFPDVYGDVWYVEPVCYAEDLGWIAGYPDGTFQPVRTVAKVEFLKILLNAYGVDVDVLDEFDSPLAADAQDINAWYFPYLRYALASSMTSADTFAHLNPGVALSRGQVALLLHRFLLYREEQRGQDLLTNIEKDIRRIFSSLDAVNISAARYAVTRARVSAAGAALRLPSSTIVRTTIKLTEALDTIVRAYASVQNGDLETGLTTAQQAYSLADATDAIGGDVRVYTDRVRSLAHILAEEIRSYDGE